MVEDLWSIAQVDSDTTIFKPTWLYIKEHKITKLKYFGKTVRDDPVSYIGSGTYWLNHLKKHGNNVDTIWMTLFTDKDELISFAVKFSQENDILNATDEKGNKIWANLMIETGIGPGAHREETKARIRKNCKGRVVDLETRKKISDRRKLLINNDKRYNYRLSKLGIKNPAWTGFVVTPDGVFDCTITAAIYYDCSDRTIMNYCKELKYSFKLIRDEDTIKTFITQSNVEDYKLSVTPTINIVKPSRSGSQGYIKCPYGIFKSSKIAETYCNLNASTIMRRCYSDKFPDWILLNQVDKNDHIICDKDKR